MPAAHDRPAPSILAADAAALGRIARGVSGLLAGWAALAVPAIALRGLVLADEALPPPALAVALLVYAGLPWLAAWLLVRAGAGRVEAVGGDVVVVTRGRRIEIARTALAGATPWWVPLPRAGVTLRLRGGGRVPWSLAVDDPAPLVAALGGPTRHPIVAWAHARATAPRRWWQHLLVKYAAFALAPAALWFNAHQHIAYGALLGQYYAEGLGRWLLTFVELWAGTAVQLVLWAGTARAVGEAAGLAATAAVPARAASVRRLVEAWCGLALYAGVPALLAWAFLR